jgi:transposase-like protein
MGSRARALAELASRPYWREHDARRIVAAWHESGESMVGFARRLGLTRHRLSRWATRLGHAEPTRLQFHPVRVATSMPSPSATAWIEIELGDGRRVRVAPGVAAEDLRGVLAVLAEQTTC